MKKYLLNRLLALVMPIVILLSACTSTGSKQLGQYDFQYRISGNTVSSPYQAFDDGAYTYFQFREKPAKPPKLAIVTPSGLAPAEVQLMPNFVQAKGIVNAWQMHEKDKLVYSHVYKPGKRRENLS